MLQKTEAKTSKSVKANQMNNHRRNRKTKNRAVWFSIIGVLVFTFVFSGFYLITNVLTPTFKYRNAIDLIDDGRLTEACSIFAQLGHYKDSDAYLERYSRQILMNAEVGDIVYWGKYEQDNNFINGKEIIQWRVLDKKQSRALLLSEKSLDEKPYNMKATDVTWETCTLRDWLNNTFIHEAFSPDERSVIVRTELTNEDNAEFGTDSGNNTLDDVFLLSMNEIEVHLPEEASRIGGETTFAIFQYGNMNINIPTWWLRSSGITNRRSMTINEYGYIMTDGSFVEFNEPVRPVIWVDLSNDVFMR